MTTFFSEKYRKKKMEYYYKKYRQILYYIAFKILRNPTEAEDAVQEAFVRIYEHIDLVKDDNPHKVTSYFITIVKNIAIDMIRRKKFEFVEDSELIEKQAMVEMPEIPDLDPSFSQAFSKLPTIYVEVLKLKYYNDFSNKDISRILKISEENVRQRLSRAKKKLIDFIEEGDKNEKNK